jgi:hypothetical protein
MQALPRAHLAQQGPALSYAIGIDVVGAGWRGDSDHELLHDALGLRTQHHGQRRVMAAGADPIVDSNSGDLTAAIAPPVVVAGE